MSPPEMYAISPLAAGPNGGAGVRTGYQPPQLGHRRLPIVGLVDGRRRPDHSAMGQ